MAEKRTALQMIREDLRGPKYLEDLRTKGWTEAVARYVEEKQDALEQAVQFVQECRKRGQSAVVKVQGPMRALKTPTSVGIAQSLVESEVVGGILHVSTEVDKRSVGKITSESGCIPIKCVLVERVRVEDLKTDERVAHFEEVQFWSSEVLNQVIRARIARGLVTITSGLDLDFARRQWVNHEAFATLQEEFTDRFLVVQLTSICQRCYGVATLTQLEMPSEAGPLVPAPANLFQGSIAPEVGELVYSARCKDCHEIGEAVELEREV